MTTYDIGDRPTVTGTFTNIAGVPTACSGVTVKVCDPTGHVDVYTSPHSSIVLGVTTTFTFPSALNRSGKWVVNMTGTQGVQAASEIVFRVAESAF